MESRSVRNPSVEVNTSGILELGVLMHANQKLKEDSTLGEGEGGFGLGEVLC